MGPNLAGRPRMQESIPGRVCGVLYALVRRESCTTPVVRLPLTATSSSGIVKG